MTADRIRLCLISNGMADIKKDKKDAKGGKDKGGGSSGSGLDWLEVVAIGIFILVLLGGLSRVGSLFGGSGTGNEIRRIYTNPIIISPRNTSDEDTLLGSIMTKRIAFSDIEYRVNEASFPDDKNRAIFIVMKELAAENNPITISSVGDKLKERGWFPSLVDNTHLLNQTEMARAGEFRGIPAPLQKFDASLRNFLNWLAVIGIAILAFTSIRLAQLSKKRVTVFFETRSEADAPEETWWKRILSLSDSNNESDWKVAIIEADVVLDEIVTKMGYGGDTLGDKLKNIEKSDFFSLDDAWEAHKYRNAIAHGSVALRKQEVKRILSLYQKVFREFEYI